MCVNFYSFVHFFENELCIIACRSTLLNETFDLSKLFENKFVQFIIGTINEFNIIGQFEKIVCIHLRKCQFKVCRHYSNITF